MVRLILQIRLNSNNISPFLQYPLVPQLMHLQVQSIQRLFLLLGSFLCLKIAMAISLATPS